MAEYRSDIETCGAFIDALASSAPTPGGGGSAALCGAIGTALGNMVGSLTVGKKKFADIEEEILQLKEDCSGLQKRFLELIDEDAEGFAPLAAAYRLPKGTPEENELREKEIERCSVLACRVPLEIMECCCEAIDRIAVFAEKGSRLAVSDAGCAAAICKAALQAASLNVFINTRSLKDREMADALNEHAFEMLDVYEMKAEDIYTSVAEGLR